MQITYTTVKQAMLTLLLAAISFAAFSQHGKYEIYALRFATLNFKVPIAYAAVGTAGKDSTSICYMLYLVKGTNGRTILVDAGFTETPAMYSMQAFAYIRPDSVLKQMHINPEAVTDIIITHPHWDHIGGIDLFPNAMIWMQEKDFNYFVGTAWQKSIDNSTFNSKDVYKIIQKNISQKLTLVKGDSIEIIPGIRVFTGSKHTYESQYVAVGAGKDKVIIASDNAWLYYNLNSLLSIPVTFDQQAYIKNLKRMREMTKNTHLIIPGHDPLVFSLFPALTADIVTINN